MKRISTGNDYITVIRFPVTQSRKFNGSRKDERCLMAGDLANQWRLTSEREKKRKNTNSLIKFVV